MNSKQLFCFGHRGACGHEPENTLRSVRRALELGADGIEVDVHFVEGELVVIHDDTLNRTTNGRGRLMSQSFAYLRSLDAGLGERIPTLPEVLDTVDRRAIVNVELKGPGTAAAATALISNYVRHRGWCWEDFLVSSFNYEQLREARRLSPHLPIGVLTFKARGGLAEFAESLGAVSVHPSLRTVTAKLVVDAHRRSLKVFVFTVNTPKEISYCAALGVDGVFTNFPERVISGDRARTSTNQRGEGA